MKKKRTKPQKKIYKILSLILIIISIIFINLIIYLDLFPTKYLFILLPLIFLILFIVIKLNKKGKKALYSLLCILLIIIEIILSSYLLISINFIENIFDNNKYSETYNLYIDNEKIKKIEDLNNKQIVYYLNDDYIDKAFETLNNRIKYTKYSEKTIDNAVNKIENNEVDAFLINKNLIDLYLENNKINLKKLTSIKIKIEKNSSYKEVNVKKDSFVVYLSGTDSSGKIASSSRSDVNILAVINPTKNKILLINTPRDYYVKLASKNSMDKLTHAGIYGIDESAKTLGNLYDVDVNYYLKINFTSFLKIIDSIGGINVNIEKPDFRYNQGIDCGVGYVCEQNSKREFDDSIIKIKYGNQNLNGEQALAYSRNRYQYADGDNARQKHQQEILTSIIKKITNKTILLKYSTILNSLSNGIKTNIDKETISKLVSKQLDNNKDWEIETLVATGSSSYQEAYSTGKVKVYVMEPNEESIDNIKTSIKELID